MGDDLATFTKNKVNTVPLALRYLGSAVTSKQLCLGHSTGTSTLPGLQPPAVVSVHAPNHQKLLATVLVWGLAGRCSVVSDWGIQTRENTRRLFHVSVSYKIYNYMCAWQQDRGEEKGGRERERGENRIGFRLYTCDFVNAVRPMTH